MVIINVAIIVIHNNFSLALWQVLTTVIVPGMLAIGGSEPIIYDYGQQLQLNIPRLCLALLLVTHLALTTVLVSDRRTLGESEPQVESVHGNNYVTVFNTFTLRNEQHTTFVVGLVACTLHSLYSLSFR